MAVLSPRAERALDRVLKPAVWVGALLPLALLVADAFTDGLGAEPIEEITHRTGRTALTLLMVTLAVTPLRRLTGWNGVVRGRRTLGLFAFFYACLHFAVYLFDQGFSWAFIVEDVAEHPYVTAGFTALLLLAPLAVTSTRGWVRRLGKGWQKLHRLVYLAAGLGVVHFLWGVKKDLRDPLLYLTVFAVLMAFRLPLLRKARQRPRRAPARVETEVPA
jgi:methionine sulfoxide reductase heme-binding subunit